MASAMTPASSAFFERIQGILLALSESERAALVQLMQKDAPGTVAARHASRLRRLRLIEGAAGRITLTEIGHFTAAVIRGQRAG